MGRHGAGWGRWGFEVGVGKRFGLEVVPTPHSHSSWARCSEVGAGGRLARGRGTCGGAARRLLCSGADRPSLRVLAAILFWGFPAAGGRSTPAPQSA
eukprot:scaffold8615_cov101-Isochrysis_galbana.AAC.1